MLKYIKNIIYVKNSMPSSQEYFKIEICDNKNILEFTDEKCPSSIQKTKSVVISDKLVINFVDKLFRTIDGWRNEYFQKNIIDGTMWQLKILYKNGNEKCYCGKNDFPNNFENLDKIKYELINMAITH